MAQNIDELSGVQEPSGSRVAAGCEGDLSRGQLELWLLEELSSQNTANNQVTLSIIDEQVDHETIIWLVRCLLTRHPIWRTTFHERDGRPVQRVERDFVADPKVIYCRSWNHREFSEWLRRQLAIPFDLSKAAFRCFFLKRCRYAADQPRANLLVILLPHIVADFSCVELYLADLNRWYANPGAAPADACRERPSFLRFVELEANMLEGSRGEELRRYWLSQFDVVPPALPLPYDGVRRGFGRSFDTVEVALPRALSARLRVAGRQRSATPYVTMLSVYFALIHRFTQAEDIVVGTPVSTKPKAFREVIGLFANVLPLRVQLTGATTFYELLDRVNECVAGARKHMHLPLADILRGLGLSAAAGEGALFDATFAWERIVPPEKNRRISRDERRIATHLASYQHGTNSALSVLFYDDGDDFLMRWNFDVDRFRSETIERIAASFVRLAEESANAPEAPLGGLHFLSSDERDRLREFALGDAVTVPLQGVHRVFESQVAKAPHATAVVQGTASLSYAELDARANGMAQILSQMGVGPDQLVAICAERSLAMTVAVLAVWKAGGAYLPIDPSYPTDRQRYMLQDSRPAVLLVQSQWVDALGSVLPEGTRVVDMDAALHAATPAVSKPLEQGASAKGLAYVIYTSGSTGLPKGVMLEHRGLCNLVAMQQRQLGVGPGKRVLQFASFSFDGWVFEFVMALCTGAELCLPPPAVPPVGEELIRLVDAHRITHAVIPPAVLAALPESARLESIELLIASGDSLSAALVRRFGSGRRFLNGYGPTETTVCATLHDCIPTISNNPAIGRPIANTEIHVLDSALGRVPLGVVGELCIGGVGVARGYLNRPELTSQRFVPNPFAAEPGGLLYKTGDLGRWLPDGTLEFIGRRDQQVKIRGFRVELGEIEACLLEYPGVREAAVAVQGTNAHNRRLAAYVVSDGEFDPAALRAHVARRMPEHLVPAAFVRLEALPLTPNGKLNRSALPEPGAETHAVRPYSPPVSSAECELAKLWSELLGVERVGRDDNFFELGGHSLLAVTLIERLRRRGLATDIRAVFASANLAELALKVGERSDAITVPPNLIPAGCEVLEPGMFPLVRLSERELEAVVARVPKGARNVQDIYPLAPLQEGVFFHHLLSKVGDAYLSVAEFAFDTRERLDRFSEALSMVVRRHDVLRTAIAWEGCPEPLQVVWREAEITTEFLEVDPGRDALAQLREHFDPRRFRIDLRQAPMLRLYAARDELGQRWVALFILHHLAGDHTMLETLQHEISSILSGVPLDQLPPPVPFRNLVAQARLGVTRAEHEAFLSELLASVAEPTAPFGLLNARGDGRSIRERKLDLEPALTARLRERARVLGASTASLCHLAWGLVLARVTGRRDVVFGTVLLGRTLGSEGAGHAMGLFINTLPARIQIGERGAGDSVRATQALLADLMRHEHGSLALAQRCSAVVAPAPLFTSLFNYRHSTRTSFAVGSKPFLDGVQLLSREERSNYPVTLTVDDLGEGLALTAHVEAPVDPERVCLLMRRALERLAEVLEVSPSTPLSAIDVLPEAERTLVLEAWNATDATYASDRCVHELVEQQARLAPGAVALRQGERALAYGDLNARANRLAHELRSLGVGPESRVAICAERSLELVVAELAVLKAGGAYVPLDPAYPKERLRYMLVDSAPRVLIGSRELAAGIDPAPFTLEINAVFRQPTTNLEPSAIGLTSSHLAYVIYTSGSTGAPKGVMIEHRNLASLIAWHTAAFELRQGARSSCLAGVGFDACVWEIWPTLCSGGELVLPTAEQAGDVHRLLTWWQSQELAVSFLPTPVAEYAFAHGLTHRSLGRLLVGGDRLRRLPTGLPFEVVNNYGPTETTVVATSGALDPTAESLPIGHPIANARVYILDRYGEPAPIGVVGELYVGGKGVGRGYLNRPDLTSERFLRDPFSSDPGARMYKTGDEGFWREDGTIEYVGRNDFQVKIRGFRIELGEVEACLAAHPEVQQAVVVAREDANGEKRLVAYVVARGELNLDDVRAYLGEQLPEYMVPAVFVPIGSIPLTRNGKIDRAALPAMDADAQPTHQYAQPEGETETILAKIWSELLSTERISRRDNFFELGGHSLLATRLVMRISQEFGANLELVDVFRAPVLREMSEKILDAQLAQFDAQELAEVRARTLI